MADGFNWDDRQSTDIVIRGVQAVAVYADARGDIVIRQERHFDEETDTVLIVPPDRVDAIIDRLRDVQRKLIGPKAQSND